MYWSIDIFYGLYLYLYWFLYLCYYLHRSVYVHFFYYLYLYWFINGDLSDDLDLNRSVYYNLSDDLHLFNDLHWFVNNDFPDYLDFNWFLNCYLLDNLFDDLYRSIDIHFLNNLDRSIHIHFRHNFYMTPSVPLHDGYLFDSIIIVIIFSLWFSALRWNSNRFNPCYIKPMWLWLLLFCVVIWASSYSWG